MMIDNSRYCDSCSANHRCTSEFLSRGCTSRRWSCVFCGTHQKGDILYDAQRLDSDYVFTQIPDIQYCPICGKLLKS